MVYATCEEVVNPFGESLVSVSLLRVGSTD